jgi:hypothetical protein
VDKDIVGSCVRVLEQQLAVRLRPIRHPMMYRLCATATIATTAMTARTTPLMSVPGSRAAVVARAASHCEQSKRDAPPESAIFHGTVRAWRGRMKSRSAIFPPKRRRGGPRRITRVH